MSVVYDRLRFKEQAQTEGHTSYIKSIPSHVLAKSDPNPKTNLALKLSVSARMFREIEKESGETANRGYTL